jgi:hypothetical protein
MGDTVSTMTPSFNGSVRVELSGQRTTSDSGAEIPPGGGGGTKPLGTLHHGTSADRAGMPPDRSFGGRQARRYKGG